MYIWKKQIRIVLNKGIKYDFPFINLCKVPMELLKTQDEAQGFQFFSRGLANVTE